MGSSNRKIEDQIRYDDGKLYWVAPRKKCLLNKECGTLDGTGYRRVHFDGGKKSTHHIVWFLHYGVWPTKELDLDHINRDKLDNRIENLREVPRSINSLNNNATNVSRNGKHWKVTIKRKSFGTFKTKEEAYKVAYQSKQEMLKESLRRTEGQLWQPPA